MNTNQSQMKFRKKLAYAVSIVFLFALTLSACTPGAQPPDVPADLEGGSGVWIEYPPSGEIFEMGVIPIVVYAASSGESISVSVGGQNVPVSSVTPLTDDGTLTRADLSFQPPGEGEYQVLASVGGGAPASVHFCIITCDTPAIVPDTVDATPTWTPTPAPGVTVTVTSTATSTPITAPSGDVVVSFYASPPYVDAGNCTTLHWDVEGSQTVYLNDTSVYFRGMEERCPCETESHKLQVVKSDGSTVEQWVTIDVYGSCTAPETEPPPVEEPPPPSSDTTGPTINAVYTFWQGCTIYGQAEISDPSGVSWAEFHYNLNGEGWNWILMNQEGGVWTSQVGVSVSDGMGTPVGSLAYKVRTLDTLNNESWSAPGELPYNGCGGIME